MAIFTPGPAVAAVSGSVGGTTFSRNKGGQYMRRRAVPTNPQSTAQTLIRNLTATNAASWQTLDEAVHDAWNAWAEEVGLAQYRSALGLDNSLSGQQAYVRLNNRLAYAGLDLLTDPPSGEAPALPPIVLPFTALAEAEDGELVTINFPDNEGVNAGVAIHWQIGVTTPRGPGRTRYQTRELRLVNTSVANASLEAAGTAAASAYTARYGAPPVGTKLGVGVRVIDADSGAISPWLLAPFTEVVPPPA